MSLFRSINKALREVYESQGSNLFLFDDQVVDITGVDVKRAMEAYGLNPEQTSAREIVSLVTKHMMSAEGGLTYKHVQNFAAMLALKSGANAMKLEGDNLRLTIIADRILDKLRDDPSGIPAVFPRSVR